MAFLGIHILIPKGYPKKHPKEQEAYFSKHNLTASGRDKVPKCKSMYR